MSKGNSVKKKLKILKYIVIYNRTTNRIYLSYLVEPRVLYLMQTVECIDIITLIWTQYKWSVLLGCDNHSKGFGFIPHYDSWSSRIQDKVYIIYLVYSERERILFQGYFFFSFKIMYSNLGVNWYAYAYYGFYAIVGKYA